MRGGFPDTLPMIAFEPEAQAQRFRDHDGEIDDEHDAARDYEAEAGRDCAMPRVTGAGWTVIVIVIGALIAAMIITAHPCDFDGRHDSTCEVTR